MTSLLENVQRIMTKNMLLLKNEDMEKVDEVVDLRSFAWKLCLYCR